MLHALKNQINLMALAVSIVVVVVLASNPNVYVCNLDFTIGLAQTSILKPTKPIFAIQKKYKKTEIHSHLFIHSFTHSLARSFAHR